jgi:anthranilate synthase/aminodeoxychorismate synthase-like glutamine amidotransferase
VTGRELLFVAAGLRATTQRKGTRMRPKLLMIDNYDSFTYNLVQYLGELGADVIVRRNDELEVAAARALAPDAIVISPGPCTPAEAGISVPLLRELAGHCPILGVCLGHQCIGAAFGGTVARASRLMHGKTSPVVHDGRTIFAGLSNPFEAMRYHSLLVEKERLPKTLEVSARTAEGEIMGLRHREYPIEGVQFHPESIGTREGKQLLSNFLGLLGANAIHSGQSRPGLPATEICRR